MNAHKMDPGRLFAIPVFTFLITVNIYVLYRDVTVLFPLTLMKLAGLANHLLIVCFYALLILLYFLRSSAISTNRSTVTTIIAMTATFIPFAFPFLRRTPSANPAIILAADLIIIGGMVLSLCALNTLGRNISIIPQARKLVQNGPYRLVRHPLYLGELIGAFGILLPGLSVPQIGLFFLLVALQIYRACEEEKLLVSVFPEYEGYCLKTACLIPGLF